MTSPSTTAPAYVYARRFALPGWLILAIMLFLGLVWRLAYVRAQGFPNDISSFEGWALALVAHGPAGFYASTNFIDYPPGYFYILGIVGKIWSLLFSGHDVGYGVLAILVKLPAILFDLGLGALIYAIARRFGSEKLALGAAALYLLNPAIIFVSALWGQVDSVACFFALLGIYALLRSDDFELPRARLWIVGGWIALAYSLLIKPQAAVLLPLFIAFACARRERRELRLWATAYGIIAAIVFTIVLVEPFYPSNPIAAIVWLLQRLSFGTNVYAYNSVNAFNLWALHFWGSNGLFWQQDSTFIGPIAQWVWGIILVCVAVALVVWRYVQVQTPQALLQAAAIALLGFFTLATRMHERYIFDGVVFTIACLPIARRYMWIAFGLSIIFWSNLTYSYQYIAVMNGQSSTPGINAAELWGVWSSTFALANVIMFFYLGYTFLGETTGQADLFGKVRNWFDPREGLSAFRKPLDYVVMWALGAASFVLSLGIPKWYWKMPAEMCWSIAGLPTRCGIFDELYFARAAEEYLKNYRIYENTHPPLTKLLIALSTLLFGGLRHGDDPMGWRFLDVVFGALVIMLLYAFARRITGSTAWAAVAAILFICDGMHYVQSRIATPEGFVVFFSLAAVYAFYRFWIASQAEERTHVIAPYWVYTTGALGAILCGIVSMKILDGLQHWIFGWPWFDTWDSVAGGRTQGPGAQYICAFYFACGFYLLFRNVVLPRYFADGAHEETFAEGSYALARAGGSEMHVVDGGNIGKGKTQRGALTTSKGSGLTYKEDGLEITYASNSVTYTAPPGSATYADAQTTTESGKEEGRHAKLWLLLFTLALGALVSSKWYGVMGFGVSFLLLILIWLQRYVVLAPTADGVEGGVNLRPALWGNSHGFHLDGALVTILFVSMTVYGLIWLPDLVRRSPDPNEIHNINDVVVRQYSMFDYHDHLVATHPYASKWFEWPFDEVPVAYSYVDKRSSDHRQLAEDQKCCLYEVTSMPNPLNLWFGLICVPLVGVLAWRQRNKGYALLIVTYLLQWLPWMRTPRLAWEYHFYVDIPLICLCNTIILQRMWRWARDAKIGALPKARLPVDLVKPRFWSALWSWFVTSRLIAYAGVPCVIGLIVIAFIFFLPVLSGWPLSWDAWDSRMWFAKWIMGPG